MPSDAESDFPVKAKPENPKILVHTNITLGATTRSRRLSQSASCVDLVKSDSESGNNTNIRRETNDSDSLNIQLIDSERDTIVLRRRKKQPSTFQRRDSISDTELKRSIKDIPRNKNISKKYANVSSRIDTGAKSPVPKTAETKSATATFTSAYATTPAIETYIATTDLKVVLPKTKTDKVASSKSPPPVEPAITVMEIGNISPDEDESKIPFTVPKKTTRLASLLIKRPSPLEVRLNNNYAPLHQQTETEKQIEEKVKTTQQIPPGTRPRQAKPGKPKNPPPIVLKGSTLSHKDMVLELKKHFKKPFTLKYTFNNTIIYPTDKIDYETFKNALIEADQEFHTYTPSDSKHHAFVLLGLQGNPALADIQEELEEEHGLQVFNIFKMKTQRAPLYLVVLSNTITLKILQSSVKTILYTRIKWERRRSERLLTQCRRCQAWGHATSNCYRLPKCVKCSKGHFTRDCGLPSGADPTCANCGGPHTASNINCPIYIKRTESMQQPATDQFQTPKFMDAPLPRTNPWKRVPPSTQQQADQPPPPASLQKPTSIQPSNSITRSIPSQKVINFQQLTDELTTLNSLIDLDQAIQAVEALNRMLQGATSSFQVISIMQNFVQSELPKYPILRSLP